MKFGPYRIDPLKGRIPTEISQTPYLRFLKSPFTKLKTQYEQSVEEFENMTELPDLTKTYYTELLEQEDGG